MCQCQNRSERMHGIRKWIQALHCSTRWDIIDCIGNGQKSTKEIYKELNLDEKGLTFAGLYFHLSALKSAGIIETASYREAKSGAPEKVWKLKIKKIVIELLENKNEVK